MDAVVTEVTECLRMFIADGQVTELRALEVVEGGRWPATFAGFYDHAHLEDMAKEACRLTKMSAIGVYFIPNAIDPRCLARLQNKTKVAKDKLLTKDVEIIKRRWLLVDADPIRPDGISSTDSEKEAAWNVIQEAREWLWAHGWEDFVLADSGNGYHLMFPLDDWPVEDGGMKERAILNAIADHCDTDEAKIDRKVFNAARIVKLYGTVSAKGDSTSDRPHRQSKVLEVGNLAKRLTVEQRDEFLRRNNLGSFDDDGKWSEQAARPQQQSEAKPKKSADVVRRARAYVSKMPGAISGQGGHTATFKVACELVLGFGLSIAEAMPIMHEFNGRCQPEWTERELLHKLRSAEENRRGVVRGYRITKKHEKDEPKWINDEILEEPRQEKYEFPLDVFPSILQRFAKEVARSTDASLDFAACAMLAMAGTCIGSTRALAVKHRNWHEMPRLFVAIVAEPGSTKSPTLKIVYKPMYALQREYDKDYQECVKRYGKNLRDWEAWKKSGGTPPPFGFDKPEEPVHKDIYSSDATTEKLIQMLRDNPRGVTLVLDEVVSLVKGMNQYKQGGKGSDRQFYLTAWSGIPLKNDRKNQHGPPGSVDHPYVGIIGGIQPDIVRELAKEDGSDDGLVPRFLYTYPNDHIPNDWDDFDVTEEADTSWTMTCQRLLSLTMDNHETGPRPYLVRMSQQARSVWAQWYNAHAIERRENTNPILKGALSKLIAYNARLTLIAHYIRWAHDEVDDQFEVDSISVMMGVQLTEYFKHNYKKVCNLVSLTSADRRAELLSKWIRDHGGKATSRDVVRNKIAGIRRTSDAINAFKDLHDRGVGTFGTKQHNGKDIGWFEMEIVGMVSELEPDNANTMTA